MELLEFGDLKILLILVVHQDIWRQKYYVDKIMELLLIILHLELLFMNVCSEKDLMLEKLVMKLEIKCYQNKFKLRDLNYRLLGQ